MTFSEYLLIEARYKGNLGMMEMFKFYEVATPEQKAKMKGLLEAGKQQEAWEFMQEVTGMKLMPESKEESKVVVKRIPDGYHDGKTTWAVVQLGDYDDDVLESGFASKKAAEAWLAKN